MFSDLTDKLQNALRRLRGVASLSESNIAEPMKEVLNALLEADVNREVAEEFIAGVSRECLGEDVLKSVTPGQMAVKIVHDKLVEFMGEAESPIAWNAAVRPNVILMVGLHGGGKTTTSAKLAALLKKRGKKVMLAACDVYRPAAIDQLEVLGGEVGVEVYAERGETDVCSISRNAVRRAAAENCDYLIVDTAGRLQIDTAMVQELVRLKDTVSPAEILLVADAALGQQAVSVAKHFHDALGITGVVLTKLDGDARGGAALSIRKVTGCPIKFVGVGEKTEDLQVFHPDRMASRILGMGDIVSLVEKAAEEIDREEAEKLQEKLKKSQFDFNDFLGQLRQMSKMGGVEAILKMLPGGGKIAGIPGFEPEQFRRMEAMICSMNKKERENPDLIDMSRRRRIARGSGTTVEQVSQLIKQFTNMRKMMKNVGLFGHSFRGGRLGSMDMGALAAGGRMPSFSRGSNYTPPKKKRKKR